MNQKLIAKSNFVLSQVLNSDDSLDILQDFIEAILKIKIEDIKLNNHNKNEGNMLASKKIGIVDVRIKTEDKDEMNVGIQIIDGKYIQTKLLLYYAQVHNYQMKSNGKIAKTITINILNDNHYKTYCYHQKLVLKNKEPSFEEEKIQLHIIELLKFQPIFLHQLNREEQWITYLKGQYIEELERVKRMNYKINKLDRLVDKYWKDEIIE